MTLQKPQPNALPAKTRAALQSALAEYRAESKPDPRPGPEWVTTSELGSEWGYTRAHCAAVARRQIEAGKMECRRISGTIYWRAK